MLIAKLVICSLYFREDETIDFDLHFQMKIINAKVFDKRGPIPQNVWPTLISRDEEAHVDQVLKAHGWKEGDTVAAPLVMTEPGSGNILGSRWVVRGPVSKVTVKATSIWPKARKDVSLTWDISAEHFQFSNRSSDLPSNVSDWLDAQESNLITVSRDENEISWSEINDGDDTLGLCFR